MAATGAVEVLITLGESGSSGLLVASFKRLGGSKDSEGSGAGEMDGEEGLLKRSMDKAGRFFGLPTGIGSDDLAIFKGEEGLLTAFLPLSVGDFLLSEVFNDPLEGLLMRF
jgi:hypothetical protein